MGGWTDIFILTFFWLFLDGDLQVYWTKKVLENALEDLALLILKRFLYQIQLYCGIDAWMHCQSYASAWYLEPWPIWCLSALSAATDAAVSVSSRNRMERMEAQIASLAAWVHQVQASPSEPVRRGPGSSRSMSSGHSEGTDTYPGSSASSTLLLPAVLSSLDLGSHVA